MAFLIDIKKQNVIPNHRVSDVYIIYQIVGAVRKAEWTIYYAVYLFQIESGIDDLRQWGLTEYRKYNRGHRLCQTGPAV